MESLRNDGCRSLAGDDVPVPVLEPDMSLLARVRVAGMALVDKAVGGGAKASGAEAGAVSAAGTLA